MKRLAIGLCCCLLGNAANRLAAQRSSGKTPVPTVRSDADAPTQEKKSPAGAGSNQVYLIGPEDVLDVTVWKEPDVSRVVPVRPDGWISLPLINDVKAAGLSPEQLAASVAEKLRKFVNEPNVTVIVTAINSQRVFVVGEVLRAGAFPLLPGMTVLQGLAAAGGFATFADVKKIHVMRTKDGKRSEIPFNYRDVLKGDNPEQNVTLEPGDTIVVP